MAGSPLLPTIEIDEPCSNSWDSMTGDERVRHCTDCNLNVYNALGLSADDLSALIAEREGRLCMRLYKRPDGSVITRDCSEARALNVREEASRIRSDFSFHHVAHASFIVVLGTLLGPLGLLLWLAIVLSCRYRQWAPQAMKLLRSSGDQPAYGAQGTSRFVRAVRLRPLHFVRSTWKVLTLAVCTVLAVSLLVGAGRVVLGVAHLALDGSIAQLFETSEGLTGDVAVVPAD